MSSWRARKGPCGISKRLSLTVPSSRFFASSRTRCNDADIPTIARIRSSGHPSSRTNCFHEYSGKGDEVRSNSKAIYALTWISVSRRILPKFSACREGIF
jgi:hypothetical protein